MACLETPCKVDFDNVFLNIEIMGGGTKCCFCKNVIGHLLNNQNKIDTLIEIRTIEIGNFFMVKPDSCMLIADFYCFARIHVMKENLKKMNAKLTSLFVFV
jgi:hypothetical protein